jgi:hypothetical protein
MHGETEKRKELCFIEIFVEIFKLTICLFCMLLDYLTKKLPVPTQRATLCLIKFESCSALLRMLMVCFHLYVKRVLSRKYLNFMLFIACIGKN